MEKIKKIIKEYKVETILLTTIVLTVVLTLVIGNSLADPNSGYLKNQTVEGLSFENANLEYKDGITTFTVEVYNENSEDFNLKTIDINLTNPSKETTTLVGYVGETLETEEGKLITASIDEDLTDSNNLQYVINK